MSEVFAWLGPVYLVSVAWPLARTDIREHRLPNKYTLPLVPIALIGQFAACVAGADWCRMAVALGWAVGAFVVGLGINRIGTLGMGDVKLITGMSLSLGWFTPIAPLLALCAAFALATIVVLFLFVTRKARMGSSIALGPYLLVGFLLSAVLAQPNPSAL
jgi:leader peptidase (prepilin peptidase)/N-methyltransferase